MTKLGKGRKKSLASDSESSRLRESDYALGAVKLNEAVLMTIWRILHNEWIWKGVHTLVFIASKWRKNVKCFRELKYYNRIRERCQTSDWTLFVHKWIKMGISTIFAGSWVATGCAWTKSHTPRRTANALTFSGDGRTSSCGACCWGSGRTPRFSWRGPEPKPPLDGDLEAPDSTSSALCGAVAAFGSLTLPNQKSSEPSYLQRWMAPTVNQKNDRLSMPFSCDFIYSLLRYFGIDSLDRELLNI